MQAKGKQIGRLARDYFTHGQKRERGREGSQPVKTKSKTPFKGKRDFKRRAMTVMVNPERFAGAHVVAALQVYHQHLYCKPFLPFFLSKSCSSVIAARKSSPFASITRFSAHPPPSYPPLSTLHLISPYYCHHHHLFFLLFSSLRFFQRVYNPVLCTLTPRFLPSLLSDPR
jgi:hypothetical protein